MAFSTRFYMGVVAFILAVNVWLLTRFLIKASKWGVTKKEDGRDDVRRL